MKLINANKIVYYLIIIFAVLSCQTSFSKSYDTGLGTDCHLNDWYELLGIDVKASKSLDQTCLKVIQKQIDEVYGTCFYENLKNSFPNFRPGPYGHRLFFHWGFSIDPCKSAALDERIKVMKLSDKGKKGLCDIFRKEQGRRNRIAINAVSTCTGLARKQSSALATLIYNVHILGDYETELVGPLANANMIHNDNKNAIKNLDFDYYDVNMILSNLDKAYATALNEKDRAQNIMMILKRDFPPLLYKRWKNTLGLNGIVIQDQKRVPSNNDPSIIEHSMKKINELFNFNKN